MAIYHFSAKVIGRSAGRSAVAAAAYRAAERLHDERLDCDHDYTKKADPVHSEIMLPDGAPARWLDRATLWNEVEAREKQCNSQLARDIEISLPRELGQAEAIRLAQDFVREQFVARGMVADLNVHWTKAADGELQPHAHVMLTMRRIEAVPRAQGERTNGRQTNRGGDPGRGTRRAHGVAQDPGLDAGAGGGGPDRDDPVGAADDPERAGAHPNPAGGHRAAAGLARLIAAARLRLGLHRHAAALSEQMGFGPKETAWNDRTLLRGWRERWAELANARLAELGHDVRIDHRSNAAQGIALEPQNKIGPAGARREERGENAERAAEHREIAQRNGERIIAEPGVALDAITRQQSTFTRRDLARFVDRHTADAAQFERAMARAEAAPELVRLGRDGRGQERFTTREMLEAERRMEDAAGVMAERDEHWVLHAVAWRVLRAAERGGLALGDEQQAAFRHVTSGADLALVVGYAGTGKSAMLGVARAAWEAEGYAVRGATLSGIAAEGLEAGSGIASRTLASLEFAWQDGRELLGPKDVLVVDEAGLVGSRQMERVLSAAQLAGAKVVLVGDPEQLQAIEAGAAFRALAERHGAAEISEVRRQRVEWQREATRELATERTGVALERYAAAGMVHAAATREAARTALVAGWNTVREQSPRSSQVMLAYTRDDVRALNELARERLRASGVLRGPNQVVQTERGERLFAPGERIMFGRNERGLGGGGGPQGRGGGVAVKNGTLGTLLAVEAGDDGQLLTVRLDGPGGSGGAGGGGKAAGPAGRDGSGAVVTFSLRDYAHVEHGYAATIHKAQGVTADRAHVLASGHMDRHAAYVALTRHRDGVALHYGRDEFADGAALARTLGRERRKDTSLDYDGLSSAPGGDGDALAERYAERRGLDPLHPVSEIVVRTPEPAAEQPQPTTRPPGMFDGLRLNAAPLPKLPAPAPASEPDGAPLSQALAKYLAAVRVAEGMRRQELPVLAHQDAAIDAAASELDACHPGFTDDLNEIARRRPDLTRQAFAGAAGLAPLIAAVQRLPADRKAEQELEAERQAKAAAQRAEHEALAPARERLLEERMRDWWRTNHPHARLSDYGFRAAQAEAHGAEAVIRVEIERMPAAELRPIAAKLARTDQQAAQEAAARPGPSPSPY